METLSLAILAVLTLIGFAAIFFTTIGTLIMFIGALAYAAMTDFLVLTARDLIVLFVLYLIGEIIEFLLTIWGAKRFGASNWAAAGAILGGIIGAVAGASFFGIGIFFGTFLGIFSGAVLAEHIVYKDWRRSFRAGTGGVLGRIGAIVVKVLIAGMMIALMALKIWGGS